MYRKLIVAIIAAAFVTTAFVRSAKAAPLSFDYCDETAVSGADWCIEYDFTEDDHGWIPVSEDAFWTEGEGWETPPTNEGLYLDMAFGETLNIIALRGTHETDAAFAGYQGYAWPTDWSADNCRDNSLANISGTHLCDGFSGSTANLGFYINVNTTFSVLRITKIKVYGTGTAPGGGIGDTGPVQPIAEELQTSADVPRAINGDVIGASTIYATTEGSSLTGVVSVYSPIESTVVFVSEYPPFRVDLVAQVDGDTWRISVSNLDNVFVLPGDKVDGNCIIGYAGVSPEESFPISPDKAILYEIVNFGETQFEDWTLHSNPDGTAICGSLAEDQSCINNNPELANQAAGWTLNRGLSGASPTAYPDVLLPGTTSISQFLELDPDTEYYATVSIAATEAFALFDVTVGDVTLSEEFNADLIGEPPVFGTHVGEYRTFLLGPFEPTEADLVPNLYNFEISNPLLHKTIKVGFACLHELDTSPISDHGLCYFEGLGDFTTTGDNKNDALGNPYIRLYDDEFMAANITLSGYEDEDATYYVLVNAWPYFLDGTGEPATVTYLYLSFDDGTEYATINSHGLEPDIRAQVSYTIVIPAGEEITADLTITHTQDDATDSQLVDVSRVCLVPAKGYYPGFEPEPESEADCPAVLAPEFNIAEPFQSLWRGGIWIWDSLKVFLLCIIPREVNRVIDAIAGIPLWIRSVGLWLGAVIQVAAEWLFDLLDYVVSTVILGLDDLIDLIWGAFIGIPIVQQFYDQLSFTQLWAAVVGIIVDLVFELMSRAFFAIASLTSMIRVFYIALRFGYNNASVPELDIPLCDGIDPDTIGYAFCAGLDLTDYGLAAFPVAQVFIVIAIGSVIYFAMIKTYEMVKDTAENFG